MTTADLTYARCLNAYCDHHGKLTAYPADEVAACRACGNLADPDAICAPTADDPSVYVTDLDCTCADCTNPACALYESEMFWDSPAGTGRAPICPSCGEPGTRPECQGCLSGAAEYRPDLPWIGCTTDVRGTCTDCGNFCQCLICRG